MRCWKRSGSPIWTRRPRRPRGPVRDRGRPSRSAPRYAWHAGARRGRGRARVLGVRSARTGLAPRALLRRLPRPDPARMGNLRGGPIREASRAPRLPRGCQGGTWGHGGRFLRRLPCARGGGHGGLQAGGGRQQGRGDVQLLSQRERRRSLAETRFVHLRRNRSAPHARSLQGRRSRLGPSLRVQRDPRERGVLRRVPRARLGGRDRCGHRADLQQLEALRRRGEREAVPGLPHGGLRRTGRAEDLEDASGEGARRRLPRTPKRGGAGFGGVPQRQGGGRPPEAHRLEPPRGAHAARRRRGHAADPALGRVLRTLRGFDPERGRPDLRNPLRGRHGQDTGAQVARAHDRAPGGDSLRQRGRGVVRHSRAGQAGRGEAHLLLHRPRVPAFAEPEARGPDGASAGRHGARHGQAPMKTSLEPPVPLLDLGAVHGPLLEELVRDFERVLRSGQFILGPEHDGFERELAQACGVKHAIGVSSGTAALSIALLALGGEAGDEATGRASRTKLLRVHGDAGNYTHVALGTNARLDALQAAFLRTKLRRLAAWTEERRTLAARYRQALAGTPVALPPDPQGATHTYHQFTIRAPKRDALADCLRERGIATRVYYPRTVPAQPCFADLGHAPGSFPVSERLAREVLSLPIYPGLRPEQVDRVAREIRAFYERTPAGTNADGGNP